VRRLDNAGNRIWYRVENLVRVRVRVRVRDRVRNRVEEVTRASIG